MSMTLLLNTRFITFPCLILAFVGLGFLDAKKENYKVTESEVVIRIPRGRVPKIMRGRPGRPGSPGPPGDAGDRGIPGYPGLRGFAGPTGPKGFPGIPGDRGGRGYQGNKGQTGTSGPRGKSGHCINENSGLVCLQGPRGKQGTKGMSGSVGNQGWPGRQGLQGPKGKQGGKGRRGARGTPGLPGYIGGPNCRANYTQWVKVDDFINGKQGMMCGEMEFLWNVIAEAENDKLRYRFHCCEFLQVGLF